MKRFLLIALAFSLAGCANLKFEWAASYKTDNLMQDLRKPAPVDPAPAEPAK